MLIRRFPVVAAVVVGASWLLIQSAVAQSSTPSAREQELEDLVRQLLQRVDRLESRVKELENTKGGVVTKARAEELEQTVARVQELEQTVEQIKEERPPPAESEEWTTMRQWFSDKSTLRPYWKDGLRLDSGDGSVKLKIGGRIQNDWAYFCEDGTRERRFGDDFDDGTEFRRARIYLSGTIYNDVEFKVQYDFAGGDADFKDVYMGLKNVPHVGNIRVGQMKPPFSLEQLTSSNNITFLERSLAHAADPPRNVGVMVYDDMLDQRMTWAAGVFRQTDDYGDGTGGRAYTATARITALPWYEDEGKKLLHFGLGYAHLNFEDDEIRYRARPESHLAPRLVDTGTFGAEYGDLIGAEAALVHGPFSVQAEYVHALMQGRGWRVHDPHFWAASVQASYFLTGEHRSYKTSTGTWGRIKPRKNFTWNGDDDGPGAWEIAARYSHLHLNDGGVDGGRLRDFSLGLNWYLNPNMRVMWNYVFADPTEGGNVDIFQMRLQMAF